MNIDIKANIFLQIKVIEKDIKDTIDTIDSGIKGKITAEEMKQILIMQISNVLETSLICGGHLSFKVNISKPVLVFPKIDENKLLFGFINK